MYIRLRHNNIYKKYKKIVSMAVSGGIDSSITAWLLKKQGYKVFGIFMKNWNNKYNCPSKKDLIDSINISIILDISLKIINFIEEYKYIVFNEFLREYSIGRTPNPDIFCNSNIKFRFFLKYSLSIKSNYIATGHYARIRKKLCFFNLKLYELIKGIDNKKDQSYFLHRLNQSQLSKSLFPIGNFNKTNIRKIANKLNFLNKDKKDSMGICFIGKFSFKNFINHYFPLKVGKILNSEKIFLGKHKGLFFYTIGQRRGLIKSKIKNNKKFLLQKFNKIYIINKNIKKNTLYVEQGSYNEFLLIENILINNIHFISKVYPLKILFSAKNRYKKIDSKIKLIRLDKRKFLLKFISKQICFSPGQSLVFYNINVCIGGGIII